MAKSNNNSQVFIHKANGKFQEERTYPRLSTQEKLKDKFKCNNCKTVIQLKDSNNSSKKSVTDVNKSFKDLEKTLKNFGK